MNFPVVRTTRSVRKVGRRLFFLNRCVAADSVSYRFGIVLGKHYNNNNNNNNNNNWIESNNTTTYLLLKATLPWEFSFSIFPGSVSIRFNLFSKKRHRYRWLPVGRYCFTRRSRLVCFLRNRGATKITSNFLAILKPLQISPNWIEKVKVSVKNVTDPS